MIFLQYILIGTHTTTFPFSYVRLSYLIFPLKARCPAVPSLSRPRRLRFCRSTHVLTQRQNATKQAPLCYTWACRRREGIRHRARPQVVTTRTGRNLLDRNRVWRPRRWRGAGVGEWWFLWNKGLWRRKKNKNYKLTHQAPWVSETWSQVFCGIYFQHEQRHRRAPWDSCHTAACHCTWWIYRSVTKKRKKKDTASHLGWFPVKFYKISSKGDKPLGGTVVLFSCGSTDMTQLPHIYWDLPTLHFASPQDMAMLCGGKKQTICFNNWAPIEQQQ